MRVTRRVTSRRALLFFFCVAVCVVSSVPRAAASGDAPQWMHALVGVTVAFL